MKDLVVGADGDDYGLSNVGTLQVFRGVPGGTFEAEPFRLLRGVYSSDRFGTAIAVCDVDGDGVDDVAATAYAHEYRSGSTYPNDTGGVEFLVPLDQRIFQICDSLFHLRELPYRFAVLGAALQVGKGPQRSFAQDLAQSSFQRAHL